KNWREPANGNIRGIEKAIEQRKPLSDGGTPLGFEVTSYEYNDFGHSWICNHIHKDMHEMFGIHLGQFGLLQNHEDAEKVYQWIEEDHQQGARAEPEPYDYWLLVSYSLK